MALAAKPNHASRGKFDPDQASRQKFGTLHASQKTAFHPV